MLTAVTVSEPHRNHSQMFNEISIENTLIFSIIGFPTENTGNFQNFENPRIFKRTFPLKLCVGSDGTASIMSKKHNSIKIFMVLKDFSNRDLLFWRGLIQILKTQKYCLY